MGTEWSSEHNGCVACPQGFYKDNERSFCQPCPDGYSTMSSGSFTLEDCSLQLGLPHMFAISSRTCKKTKAIMKLLNELFCGFVSTRT